MNLPGFSDSSRKIESSGSPPSGEPVYLIAGRLRRPHGISGEILMEVLTDFPDRMHTGRLIYTGPEYTPLRITHLRTQNRFLLLRLEGITTPEQARGLSNQYVYVRTDLLPDLPEGEYYHHQLIGLAVEDQDGNPLGSLVEIITTSANDVYVVKSPEGKELLIPAIASAVLEVDLTRGSMRVHPPEWA
ncbi:MAG: ribosome maturation factor RimM [Chloroflexi bacterium]|nr:ribosome maturation factor RimM [Chloroflexota bacterium]